MVVPPPTLATATDLLTPRVVFFGPPHSGKSALLAEFVRLAAGDAGTETALPPPTEPGQTIRRELVPHLIRVRNPAAGPTGGTFILCDCDGRAAGELLSHPDALVRGAARGALAQAVRSADALVLVVDAAAPPGEVDRTFENFGQFLDGLEEGRTFGREVGGLPVFLTLTKCDALYQKGDTATDWLNRITERERDVRQRFEAYFGGQVNTEPASFLPFGSIDLHLAATSIHAPPGLMFEPYTDADGSFGVTDLVRDSLPAARAFRNRVLGAHRRLRWTVTGAGMLLGAMLLGLLVLVASGGFGASDELAERVRAYRANEPPPAVYLAERNFAAGRAELRAIRDNPGFERLPAGLRQFVEDRLREFDVYKEYRARFQPPRLGPAEVQTLDQVEQLADALRTELAPPPEYARAWAETEAVRLWKKWQTDLALVREAADRLTDWYRNLIRRGNELLLTEQPLDSGWRSRITALLHDAQTPPFRPEDVVEGSPTVPVLRGQKLTYASAYNFERVEQARRDWIDTRDRLRHLRDFTDALGLTSGPGTRPPVLDLPEPPPDGSGSKQLAAARLSALRAAYPASEYPDADYPQWDATNFPDPVRKALDTRLRLIFETGVRHVRRLIGAALGTGPETLADWRRVADALLQQEELKAWGRLLQLLRKWADPSHAADPVRELVEFVRRDEFRLNLQSVTIAIPDDLLAERAAPSGRFVLTLTPAGGKPTEYHFRQQGEPKRDRPYTFYTFVPDGHPGTLTYRPGDGLSAALPIRAGTDDYRLLWSSGRSVVYQLDRLWQPPRLEKGGLIPNTEPAPGVRLTVAPPGGLPPVPVLLPDLRPGSPR
jgi:hypothetical protein